MGKDGALVAPIPHTTDVEQFALAIDKVLCSRESLPRPQRHTYIRCGHLTTLSLERRHEP